MGDVYKRMTGASVIGLDYLPKIGTKGFDEVCVIRLDGNQEELSRLFRESDQFSKLLIPVQADPKSLVAFLQSPEWEPTTSCVGGVFNYIGSRFGRTELENAVATYNRNVDVKILPESPSGNIRNYIQS